MKKLLAGIVDFRKNIRPSYREKFARLALGQAPDCLFVACSDSRVVPNLFASTEPGDLFVVRNVGNLVPRCEPTGRAVGDLSEAAAVEFAVNRLGVRDIIVCGHSECGAMQLMLADNAAGTSSRTLSPNLHEWLDAGQLAVERLKAEPQVGAGLAVHNRLSQVNVLQQLDNLRSYPIVRERLDYGALRLHAWWFDLTGAEVLMFDQDLGRFIPIGAEDEVEAT